MTFAATHEMAATPWPGGEPPVLLPSDFDDVLVWAFRQQASDVLLCSDEPPLARLHGTYVRLGRRAVSSPEINEILAFTYGANASARISAGDDLDYAYDLVVSREERIRWRMNATGGQTARSAFGTELCARAIASVPPSVEELGIEPEIIRAHREVVESQGLVLVVGATGTGKTTLLAALLRDVLTAFAGKKVLTYEAPIEYLLSNVPDIRGHVVQTEVHRHLPSFARGVSNALRRAPDVILIGEARDPETMRGVVQAALTGHAVFTTIHAPSVAAALPRMLNEFPAVERRGEMARLLDVTRLIVTQRLLPRVGGGRVAIREYLRVSQSLRLELLNADPDRLQTLLHAAVHREGRSFLTDARAKRDAGLISAETLRVIEAEWESEA